MKWEKLPVGPFAMNCYILSCEDTGEGIIVDPGDEVDSILSTLEKLDVKLLQIVITHGHVDHVLQLKKFQDLTGLPTAMHPLDQSFLTHLPQTAQLFGLESAGVPSIDIELEEGQTICFGRCCLEVVHTPGHTPGSISLIGENTAVVGDVLFNGSIGRTDLPGASYPQLIESIKKKLMVLEDHVKVLPGHGEVTTIGFERLNNPFLK
ncbi:MAG: MBL fold metallo-hydrolase [Calditrichaeota bacterium]|nr:MAG: MBL fold metallo-hydrolase [Calditrichota bacterium]